MTRSAWRLALPMLGLLTISACNGSGLGPGGTGPGSGNTGSSLTATVDGSSWASDASLVKATSDASLPGALILSGTMVSGSSTLNLSLELGFLSGSGTYPLGVNQLTTPGGVGLFDTTSTGSFGSWATPFTGNSGSVVVTISGSRVSGTFHFDAAAGAGGTGTKSVTNGKFDVALPSTFSAASSSNHGSTMSATLSGIGSVTEATIVGTVSGTSISLGGNNTTVTISIIGSVTPNATIPFQTSSKPGVLVQVSQLSAGGTTWGGFGQDSGTVAIGTLTSSRVTGTFNGTLIGASGSSLTITNGAFDVALKPGPG